MGTRIPGSLFSEVNLARARTGETHEMWFTRHLELNLEALHEHYKGPEEPRRFPVRTTRRRRQPGELLAQYPLRLTAEEDTALRELFEELGAPSLSDLATTNVRLGLDRERATAGPAEA